MRERQILENKFQDKARRIMKKYNYLGSDVLKDQKLNKLMLFDKNNFNELKNMSYDRRTST